MTSPPRPPATLLSRGSWPEASRVAAILRKETVGGALLLIATVAAMVWANSPFGDSYAALRDYRIGPAALHLDLTLGQWATDGLLAFFFFVVGLELKREFAVGELSHPATGGSARHRRRRRDGGAGGDLPARQRRWPTAGTAGLGRAHGDRHRVRRGRHVRLRPTPPDVVARVPAHARGRGRLRRDHHHRHGLLHQRPASFLPLLGAVAPLALFAVAVQRRIRSWWLLLPLAATAWSPGPRIRGARHRCRGPARIRRAGGPSRDRPAVPWAGRALRAPVPSPVLRSRGTGVRVLRRRCFGRWRRWTRRQPHRLDHPGHRRGPDRW